MKDQFDLRISQDGTIEGIYQDGLADALGADVKKVERASNVEFEDFSTPERPNVKGWTVRSAKDPELAIRIDSTNGRLYVGRTGSLFFFGRREDALEHEVEHFWEILEKA